MLPTYYRMRASSDFATAIKRGKRRKTQTVAVHALYVSQPTQADLSNSTKVGFVVSKKVGNSVVRHRVTRQLRHIVRAVIPFSRPALVVVRAQPRAATASFHRIQEDVLTAFADLGLIATVAADIDHRRGGSTDAPTTATPTATAILDHHARGADGVTALHDTTSTHGAASARC
ncbi:MAG: ribonuclease P protein component [Arcanobacterium sp.]|nr:ribonuclease P protein component [Arcanobacterium sp.]